MTDANRQEISLGNACDAVVHYGETTIELHHDGELIVKTTGNATVYTNGDVEAYTSGSVKLHPVYEASAVAATAAEPKPGQRMEDGTIFAGISPDTNKAMYTTPTDARLSYRFSQAQQYAGELDAHGHSDWRAPTKKELNVLFNNRAAIGEFDGTPDGSYWSSSKIDNYGAWVQRFRTGTQVPELTEFVASLRCVRG